MSSNFVGRVRLSAAAICVVVFFASAASQRAAAQGRPTADPALNRRMENERNIRDQQRTIRGMEIDAESRKLSKEERQRRAAEDFMRLQVLHNQMLELITPPAALHRDLLAERAAEASRRAANLRVDLVLPEAPKDEQRKKTESAAPATTAPLDDARLEESLGRLCALIRSFVANLNASPADKKAGARARLDLDRIVELGDEIAARTGTPQKPTN